MSALVVFGRGRAAHRLDASCPDCGCAVWLHTAGGCLTLRRGNTQRRTQRCGCRRTIAEFTS